MTLDRQDQFDALVEAVVGEGVEAIARQGESPKAGREVSDSADPNRVQMKRRRGGLGEQNQSSSS
jgi:hypothetical protein